MKILLLFCLLGSAWALPPPNCTQINTMIKAIASATRNVGGSIPLLVRLGFHDCAGGCDGCVDLSNNDNAGLKPIIDMLDGVYPQYSSIVTKADFYALGATVGVTLGLHQSNSDRTGNKCTFQSCSGPCPMPCFDFKWGRVTSNSCTAENLPSPKMTGTAMFQYFATNFGFTKEQVVALMGAHSLGGANTKNSGYRCKWTGDKNRGFSEAFFSNFLNTASNWSNIDSARPLNLTTQLWQFLANFARPPNVSTSQDGMMFNTDVEVFYDLTLDSNSQATCSFPRSDCGPSKTCSSQCAQASTFGLAQTYASNCTRFINDFQSVFQLMLQKGSTALVSSGCCQSN